MKYLRLIHFPLSKRFIVKTRGLLLTLSSIYVMLAVDYRTIYYAELYFFVWGISLCFHKKTNLFNQS